MRLIYRIKQMMVAGGDMLSFILAFWLSLTIRYWQAPNWQKIETHIAPFFWLFLIWLVINFINGLYDLSRLKTKDLPKQFITTAAISFAVGIGFFYIFANGIVTPKTILLLTASLGYLVSYVWRLIYGKFIGLKRLHENIIFVGYTPETQELINAIQNHPEGGYKIVALIDPENQIKPEDLPFFDVYRSLQAIRPAISNHKATTVIISPRLRKDENVLRELYSLLFWDVQLYDLPSFYEIITGRITPTIFSEAWFLENIHTGPQPLYKTFRAILDFAAIICIGVIFLLTFTFIAIAIKLESTGPIFFKQKRVGKGGKVFFFFFFRSMKALAPDGSAEVGSWQFAKKDDLRQTWVGAILRKSRLDEIPQCLNIIKGDISLIGPRPERPEIVEQLQTHMPYYSLRHAIKPGLTGWAVIHQNYTDDIEKSLQKLQYDLFYIKNRSFLLDLSIILRTINLVIRMMGQ
ncbi:MAG: exopolysaccharide biosynthesis polyprenyl glycosylphosphotransferase [Candidatus Magasanikbacteria bacterium]|nr:exopolysaccharide biosynthesis polyprenyl glycosylphosphotransferase [Candidatus Magasanikbacteria bacterium]